VRRKKGNKVIDGKKTECGNILRGEAHGLKSQVKQLKGGLGIRVRYVAGSTTERSSSAKTVGGGGWSRQPSPET